MDQRAKLRDIIKILKQKLECAGYIDTRKEKGWCKKFYV